jgi:predicted metal-dependent hydrolase
MAAKSFELPGVGTVHVYKRRGSRNIRLSVNSDGKIRVTVPAWLPYKAGLTFATQKQAWLTQQKPQGLKNGQRLGKHHSLQFIVQEDGQPRTQLKSTEAIVYHQATTPADQLQALAQKVSQRALRQEAEQLLPQRLAQLAAQHHFSYQSVSCRHLKSRWGSCDSKQRITLNYYLMQLPWNLIDYVIIHELAHTQELHHGDSFWALVASCLPNYKTSRQQIKHYQPSVLLPKSTTSMP